MKPTAEWPQKTNHARDKTPKIAIIGYGHMGKALAKGLLSGGIKKTQIAVSNSSKDNAKAAAGADWIILTVKPLIAQTVLNELKDVVKGKIIITAVAGLTLERLVTITNKNQKAVRIVPNLPVAQNKGVVGLYANKVVSRAEKKALTAVFSKLGSVIERNKETDLEVITLIAGCGPALVAYCIEMFEKAGKQYGLPQKDAETVALQTFAGTLAFLKESGQTAVELQKGVATKGGVTEQIISRFDTYDLPERFINSLKAGYDRIQEFKKTV